MDRPGYAPRDLLKLYIYGYLNRVRSSRRLAGEPTEANFRNGLETILGGLRAERGALAEKEAAQ